MNQSEMPMRMQVSFLQNEKIKPQIQMKMLFEKVEIQVFSCN